MRRTLTARAVLVTCLVAFVSVVVTALVAAPLAVRGANQAARKGLADQAQIAAVLIGQRTNPQVEAGLVRLLRANDIEVYFIRDGRLRTAGSVPARLITALGAGQEIHNQTAVINRRLVLVEGRPLANAPGNGVLLTEPAATGLGGLGLLRGLWWALLAGLAAGAVAGGLLARRLARPIRHAAGAAVRLSAGDRSVRLRPEPPAEVEELAHALNGLAAALATSEGRQREFLLSVSHELRTPLTTIKGYAEALADGVIAPDGAPRAGQTVLTEAENLDRLVGDLLALARLDAVDFPVTILPVDLVELMSDAARAWVSRCQALRVEFPREPVPVATDPGRLRQVVDGLLDNALRVLPPGAPVVLAVRPADGSGLATVEVRDGGPGFAEEDLALVFQRGAMSERYRGVRQVGSGLGLALAHGLVRRLGGTIEAGRAPEGGARFTVQLPVYQPRTSH
ncbi:MAG: two-component sensor histidine kinase [Actinobacteria bacterium 13_2_20CM_2_72_6]|nr:MAG: two-component sensor histidine kinase [Actinobacteria bacterium 13_2_20CM_2_72_6]